LFVAAFNRDDEGYLKPAFDPRQMQSADNAKRLSRSKGSRLAAEQLPLKFVLSLM
jgi:hypothetical protein